MESRHEICDRELKTECGQLLFGTRWLGLG